MDNAGPGWCFIFGHFALYPEIRQLYRHGIRLKTCHPQQAAFLAILAEHPGLMVTKKELESRLWPGEIPHKNRLNVLASTLWTLLDDTNPEKRKYFAAAGREGYCFICPVERVECPETRQSDLAKEAYRAGRHCMEDHKASSLREAASCFKRAIDHNPSYALAWVGLADAHIIMGMHCVEAPRETFAKAQAAAQEAMQILPALSEAQVSLAWIALCYNRDWRKAEDGFLEALQRIPAYSFAHSGLALLQVATGRVEDSLTSITKAAKFTPLSPPMSALLCRLLYYARRFSEAVEVGLKAVGSDPGSCIAHVYLAHAMLRVDRQSQAMDHFDQARTLSGSSKVYLGFWAYACAVLGMRKEAEQTLKEVLSVPSHEYVPSYFVGLIHLGLGQNEECMDWLERASDEHSPWVLFLNSDPVFDRIRSHGRFQELLERVGLQRIPRLATSKEGAQSD